MSASSATSTVRPVVARTTTHRAAQLVATGPQEGVGQLNVASAEDVDSILLVGHGAPHLLRVRSGRGLRERPLPV